MVNIGSFFLFFLSDVAVRNQDEEDTAIRPRERNMLGHWVPGVKKEEEDTRHDQREERQLMVCAWRLHPNTRNQAKGMLEV